MNDAGAGHVHAACAACGCTWSWLHAEEELEELKEEFQARLGTADRTIASLQVPKQIRAPSQPAPCVQQQAVKAKMPGGLRGCMQPSQRKTLKLCAPAG